MFRMLVHLGETVVLARSLTIPDADPDVRAISYTKDALVVLGFTLTKDMEFHRVPRRIWDGKQTE